MDAFVESLDILLGIKQLPNCVEVDARLVLIGPEGIEEIKQVLNGKDKMQKKLQIRGRHS